jgi:DNA polymerase-3 subunit delta
VAAKGNHALDFLALKKREVAAVYALYGDEPFLKQLALDAVRRDVLGDEDDTEWSLHRVTGKDAEVRDVLDEVSTPALFGGGTRLVVVDDADKFVSDNRPVLEAYAGAPSRSGVLVLVVDSWPSNTRLAKAVAAGGLAVQCSAPPVGRMARWVTARAKDVHAISIDGQAIEALLEIVGADLGRIDQELGKLAAVVGSEAAVTIDHVQDLVGGWRAKTAWDMLDMALAGDAESALTEVERLVTAGEHPIGILAQIAATLRRLAEATRRIEQAEATGRRINLRGALEQSGVRSFVVGKAEKQLRRLGRVRGKQIYGWLLEADLALKGASTLPPRAVLEGLILRLAAPTPARVA